MQQVPAWLRQQFQKALPTLTAVGDPSERQRAFGKLDAQGLPTPALEEWKYTDISEFFKNDFAIAERSSLSIAELEALLPAALRALPRIVLCNGYLLPELSSVSAQEGVSVVSIAEMLAQGAEACPPAARQAFEREFNQPVLGDQALYQLQRSFVSDGVFIHVAAGVRCTQPVHIISIHSSASGAASISFPRVLVVAEPRSEVTLVETHLGQAGSAHIVNSVTELVARQGSHLAHCRYQHDSQRSLQMGYLALRLEREAVLRSHLLSFGGQLGRNEISAQLSGPAAELHLGGFALLQGKQHLDTVTVVDHASEKAASNQTFKGVYGDSSRGIFSGTIIVREAAQQTNAYQSNKSLLLSEQARVDTRPQLKIWADDVKCTHGATIGQLDQDAFFYLRSRGLDPQAARTLLVQAFCCDILRDVAVEAVREIATEVIVARLGQK
jgi:Fe-S cluster assembly protein SufD